MTKTEREIIKEWLSITGGSVREWSELDNDEKGAWYSDWANMLAADKRIDYYDALTEVTDLLIAYSMRKHR